MSQNKTQTHFKIMMFLILTVSVFSSCAKKESGVRATVKSQQTNLNPTISAQADQQAASMNANYKIATVSIPEATEAGYAVNVELTTPSGEVLPLRTRHENGNTDSEGVYNDTQRGLQVHVLARCSQGDCYKYTLIVTTAKNNQAIYQALAISYKDDCKFNAVSASYSVGSFLMSLNDAEYAESKYQVSPKNDCPL